MYMIYVIEFVHVINRVKRDPARMNVFCLGIVSAYNFLKGAYLCATVSGHFKDARLLPLNRKEEEEEEEEGLTFLLLATRCLTLIFSVLNSPFHISCIFQSTF